MTLLDMTQNILSSLNADEVNSISDTAESLQVAEVIRTTFFNIVNRSQLPEHKNLFSLDAASDVDLPVLMYKPDNVSKIEWIKYDTSDGGDSSEPSYNYVTILPIDQFLDKVNRLDPDDTAVDSMTINDVIYYFYNDRQPAFCTILKDYYIIFDGYNQDVDTTLQETKSLCYGSIVPTFTMSDTFIPDLEDNQFPLLLNEAKALAFFEIKQTPHPKAEQEARRQWRSQQHNKHLRDASSLSQFPDYGRIRGAHRGPNFEW